MPHRQFRANIALLITMIAITLSLGTLIFSRLEGWTLLNSFYFVTMTATTVGYGDFVPATHAGKVLTIIYSLSIVPFVLYTFSIVAKYNVDLMTRKITRLERKQHEQEEELDATERKLERQRRKLREQEIENENQEKELEKQKRALSKQKKDLKIASEELDVVEDVVEGVIEDEVNKGRKKVNSV